MAHQSTNIPWNVLASNFKWSVAKHHPDNGDLHLRFNPDQGKKLHYFIEAFVRNIRNHSATTRKRYPKNYDPPNPDDIILDDAITKKITPTVHRWRSFRHWEDALLPPSVLPIRGELCQHGGLSESSEECRCPIPYDERKAAAFYRQYFYNQCYWFFKENGRGFFNLEMVKTLMLYGEMDVILRVCASPDVKLWDWWRLGRCECEPDDAGWNTICITALLPYLALNLIHCFPETWDAASGRTDDKDYRRMRIYQYMLKQCTMGGMTSEVATYPHRQFFGIQDGQFHVRGHPRDGKLRHTRRFPYGLLSFENFLSSEKLVEPKSARSAVRQVQETLYSKGLPMELVLEIMGWAGYTEDPNARLEVPHDPFHPENREELAKYLRYCWQLLVRCDMLAAALGKAIPWRYLISKAMIDLFSCDPPDVPPTKWYKWHDSDVIFFK